MNSATYHGEWVRVLRCDEQELHISSSQRDQLAYVFHKAQAT